jgi:2-keto-4-pentenoate hydratase
MIETAIDSDPRAASTDPAQVAASFRHARINKIALQGYPGPAPQTLEQAYRIQDQAIKDWPDRVSGWKVGRILGALVDVHGTDRLIGPIFASSIQRAQPGAPSSFTAIQDGFCAVEGEFVFELAQDAQPSRTDYDSASALELVGALWTGIEIAGSPLATINALGPTVVVSDFGNNLGLILGAPLSDWHARLEHLRAGFEINDKLIGEGAVSAFPGGITKSLVFALNCAASRGMPLKRGMLISTGAVTGVHDIKSGEKARALFGPDGDILCQRLPTSNHYEAIG